MKLQYLIIPSILLVLFLYSCRDNQTKKTGGIVIQKSKIFPKNKPGASFSDTLIINSAAAVFYVPDSLQLIRISSSMDPGAFAANMHEYENLINTSRSVIKNQYPHLQIIDGRNVKYLLFITPGKTKYLIDLDKLYDPCGLYVFDEKKPPLIMDMANVETGLHFYFHTK